MMAFSINFLNILIGLLTILGVGELIRRLINNSIKKSIQYQFDKLLEKEKVNLETLKAINSNLLDAAKEFPKIIGVTRDICRNILTNQSFDKQKALRLDLKIKELSTELDKFSLLIEKRVWIKIHGYKKMLQKFFHLYLQMEDSDDKVVLLKKLQSIQSDIEEERYSTVEMFSKWLHNLEGFKVLEQQAIRSRDNES